VDSVDQVYREYGCQKNQLSVPELFEIYEKTGFLYPEKKERLRSYFPTIIDNWERVIGSTDDLMFVASTSPKQRADLATITSWRSTSRGWMTQHLACVGDPMHSRAVMLSSCEARIMGSDDESQQLWFRPNNRFPRRVFGSMVEAIGPENSSLMTYGYFALPRLLPPELERGTRVETIDHSSKSAFVDLVRSIRGPVYAYAEELDRNDICLHGVDLKYRKVGLRRFREIRVAYSEAKSEPIAATVTYRGPLGLNFSFLENRTDLIVSSMVSPAELLRVLSPLLHASLETYEGFELDWIPLIAPDFCGPLLVAKGAHFVRQYSQGIWLREGFRDWFNHIDSFYTKLLRRQSRRTASNETLEPRGSRGEWAYGASLREDIS
jgi:hypothetical protein